MAYKRIWKSPVVDKRHSVSALGFMLLLLLLAPLCSVAATEVPSDVFLSEFYRAQGGYGQPGKVLKVEPLSEKQQLAEAGESLRVLYTSTEGLWEEDLVAVSGVLYLPKGEAPASGWPLVSWSHGTVGINDRCAPSWNGRQAQDENYLNEFLVRGFAVVASDYQGLGTLGLHPYLATRPAAYSNLDLIRAVQNSNFPLAEQVLLLGQSQGASAAISTASLAPDYAPEINVVGVVATGAPYFTPATMKNLDRLRRLDQPDPLLGYTFLGMILAEHLDPAFERRDFIADVAWGLAEDAQNLCYRELKLKVVEANLMRGEVFKKNPIVGLEDAFTRMSYPHLAINVPVFLGTGQLDRDTPYRMQAKLVQDMCAANTVVHWQVYPDLDHRGVVLPSLADSLPFVRQVFAGDTVASRCPIAPE